MFIFIYYKLLFNSRGKVEFGPVGDNMQNSTPEGGVGGGGSIALAVLTEPGEDTGRI